MGHHFIQQNLFNNEEEHDKEDHGKEGRSPLNSIHGEIKSVIFENESTGYAVLRIMTSSGEVIAVGPLSGARQGEEIDATGYWDTHKEYGKQFVIENFRFTLPSTTHGILKYLSSGALPGVGEKTAKAIVDFFGKDSLKILDSQVKRLHEIPGLGLKKIKKIGESWKSESERREIYIFLHGLGIGPAQCRKLYNRYGEATGRFIQQNPYQLADDIHGIGFLTADRIAEQLGIGKNSTIRIRAGILFAFKQLALSGNTTYPKTHFMEYCQKLLDLSELLLQTQLDNMIAEKRVIQQTFPQLGTMIYDVSFYKMENELAFLVKNIVSSRVHAGQKLNQKNQILKISFSKEQLFAIENIANSPLSIITGGPGVGKTTVIGEIVKRALDRKLKILLAAPTGRAAKRMAESTKLHCSTIHRLLKWDPEKRSFQYDLDHKLPCNMIIIDEISMLDLPLATYLFRAIRPGTTVVLVGDADQLPSVGPGKVLHDLIQSEVCPTTHLSRIYRQGNESLIVANAHAVNHGNLPTPPPVTQKELFDFYWVEQDDPEKVSQMIADLVSVRLPKKFSFQPMSDIQVLCPMNKGECGVTNLNTILQSVLNSQPKLMLKIGERILKLGDRVMQTVNNYELNVFNGDLGRITAFGKEQEGWVGVDFDGHYVRYGLADATQLTLAYATTVHKAQGSEFPCVVMPVLTQHFIMLQRNLLYTGMTRAKKLLILIGSKKAISMAVKNYRIEPRFSTLLQRLNEKK